MSTRGTSRGSHVFAAVHRFGATPTQLAAKSACFAQQRVRGDETPLGRLAAYLHDYATSQVHADALLVLSIQHDAIGSICRLGDLRLFARLGLPPTLDD